MRTLICFLLLTISAHAETFLIIAPMTDGRPPVVAGDYDWSCVGRCDTGEPDAILQITTTDAKVAEALKASKDVKPLVTYTNTGQVYEPLTKKIITATSLARVDTKPVEYKVELMTVEETKSEEITK